MRSKYYFGGFIVLILIVLLGVIGFYHKKNGFTSEAGETKVVDNFEISSKRINCEAIKLKVYNNNTYKVIYGYETNKQEREEIAKTGTYTYDISKIVANNHKYEKNEHGTYLLIDKDGIEYQIYDTNEDLNKFLKEIDINLDTCLELNY